MAQVASLRDFLRRVASLALVTNGKYQHHIVHTFDRIKSNIAGMPARYNKFIKAVADRAAHVGMMGQY